MDKSIFGFIWRFSKREQIIVLLITLASFPFLYLSLEVPKLIVNEALTGENFPREVLGFELGQIAYLMVLCSAFLLLVLTNGVFKMRINIYKGTIAERMMRRLRYQLVERILRFPPDHFKRVSQGDLIPMVTAEVEPLGGLMGDAIGSPVFLGGQMLTIAAFLFVQNPLLGFAAIALIPLQAYVIPILQRRVNLLNREKVKRIRSLSNQIGETVSGVGDIHVNDTAAYMLSNYSQRLAEIFRIRLEVYNKKFFMKFLNNLINQITPFFFYSIGGYLVITGDLSIGALVAALGAYKDLTSPWRDLLAFYNQVQDSSIRYEAIVEQFAPKGMKHATAERPPTIPRLDGPIEISNASWQDQDGIRALHNVSLVIPPAATVAIAGSDEIGRNRLAQLLSREINPVSGRITIGGESYDAFAEAVIGARVAYVGPENYLFSGTVADNVQFGLNRKPPSLSDPTPAQLREIREARATGNSPYPTAVSWLDYDAAGYANHEEFVAFWLRVLDIVDTRETLFSQGLQDTLDAERRPELAARLLEVRARVGERLAAPGLDTLVRRFDADEYNPSATVAENILFGTPADDRLAIDNLSSHPFIVEMLRACELTTTFAQLSLRAAEQIVEIFSDVSPGHPYFERFSFVDEELVPRLKLIHARAERGIDKLNEDDRKLILSLPFRLIPERHRLGLIDESLQARLLVARRWFAEHLPDELQDAVVRFDPQTFHPGHSIFDNLVFGELAASEPGAREKVLELVMSLLEEQGLRDEIVLLVDDVQVGRGGLLVPAAAREQIGLARALAKRPDILICNRAIASLPATARSDVFRRVRELLPATTIVWMDREPLVGVEYDAIYQMSGGRLSRAGAEPAAAIEPLSEDLPEAQQELNALAGIPLFASLSPANLKLLALAVQRRDYGAGENLFAPGDTSDGAYVVLSGELEMVDDSERPLAQAGPGEIAGEVAVIANVPRKYATRARVATTALFIQADALRELIENDVRVASAMLASISTRVVDFVEALEAA